MRSLGVFAVGLFSFLAFFLFALAARADDYSDCAGLNAGCCAFNCIDGNCDGYSYCEIYPVPYTICTYGTGTCTDNTWWTCCQKTYYVGGPCNGNTCSNHQFQGNTVNTNSGLGCTPDF
jgi:hypothetical protein